MCNPYNSGDMRLSCPPPWAVTGRSENTMGGGTMPWTMVPWNPPWCKPEPWEPWDPNGPWISRTSNWPWCPPFVLEPLNKIGKRDGDFFSLIPDEVKNFTIPTINQMLQLYPNELQEIVSFIKNEFEKYKIPEKTDPRYLSFLREISVDIYSKLMRSEKGQQIMQKIEQKIRYQLGEQYRKAGIDDIIFWGLIGVVGGAVLAAATLIR